jgi:hypothetical protein
MTFEASTKSPLTRPIVGDADVQQAYRSQPLRHFLRQKQLVRAASLAAEGRSRLQRGARPQF